ncbi:MAG: sugar phosphate isomerase/epimerase family protein [Christensenellales bacterium]|jgi:3-dehydroshikimate dehydratase
MFLSGLVSVTFRGKTPDRIIDLCVESGLGAVEWGENAHVFPGDEAGSAELRKKTLAAGLKIAAYGSYYRCETKPEEGFAATLMSAKALGAPVIRIWPGRMGSDKADDEYFRTVAKNAVQAAGMAADEGIKAAFEWHQNTLTDTNESAKRLLEMAESENLLCLWQPTPEIPMEERTTGIEMLGERLSHMHVYSWSDDRIRQPFDGEGFLDKWRQYFSAVKKQGDCYALLEFVKDDSEEQLARDAAALKKLLREMDGIRSREGE